MNRRFITALLTLSLVSTVAACGGDDGASTQTTSLELSGVYRPVDQGPIGSITFSGKKDYLLVPSGCVGGGCAESGTYRLDTASHVLVLENGQTHATRSIALEIVTTTPASGALVKSLAPLDLVDPGEQLTRPGGQQLTNGSGQQLATGGNGLTGAVSQLLQIIQQAIMNGQQMKRDDAAKDPKADPKADPKDDCKQGVPTKDTPPADAAAYWARCPKGP